MYCVINVQIQINLFVPIALSFFMMFIFQEAIYLEILVSKISILIFKVFLVNIGCKHLAHAHVASNFQKIIPEKENNTFNSQKRKMLLF